MKTRSYLKHAALTVLADAVLVNLGLFLGLVARYAVLVGLNEAPIILPYFTTPADLWRDSIGPRWVGADNESRFLDL
jgi:hypothetical protein